MVDFKKDWLPLGSVVRLVGGERLLLISGFMAINQASGLAYDYVGYPYPEGKQTDQDLFFDRDLIEEVYHIGLLDRLGLRFQDHLKQTEESYLEQKGRRSAGGDA